MGLYLWRHRGAVVAPDRGVVGATVLKTAGAGLLALAARKIKLYNDVAIQSTVLEVADAMRLCSLPPRVIRANTIQNAYEERHAAECNGGHLRLVFTKYVGGADI
jgi:hypothetical protein